MGKEAADEPVPQHRPASILDALNLQLKNGRRKVKEFTMSGFTLVGLLLYVSFTPLATLKQHPTLPPVVLEVRDRKEEWEAVRMGLYTTNAYSPFILAAQQGSTVYCVNPTFKRYRDDTGHEYWSVELDDGEIRVGNALPETGKACIGMTAQGPSATL